MLTDKINELLKEVQNLHAANAEELEVLRLKYLSKKGIINDLMNDFRDVAAEQKREVGMKLNELKKQTQDRIAALKEQFEAISESKMDTDLTRTAYPIKLGTRHPITLVKNEIIDIFGRMGFTLADGPEVEDDLHVFTKMNFAADHPARDMQDTFFIENNEDDVTIFCFFLAILEQFDGPVDELREGFALQLTAGEEGDVDELVHALFLSFGLVYEGLDRGVRGVEDEGVAVRHIAVEVHHTLLVRRHLFHTPHELVLGEEDRQGIGRGCFAGDRVFEFVFSGRKQRFESFAQTFFLLVGVLVFGRVLFANEVLDGVRVDADEAQFLVLLLGLRHAVHIEFAVHEEDVVALRFRALYIGVVCVGVVGVEQDEVAVLVGLSIFYLSLVFIERRILAVEVLDERKIFRLLVELLVGEHTELDKHLDVVPLLREIVLVGLVEFCQFVSHFLGDVAGDFLDVIVRLEV